MDPTSREDLSALMDGELAAEPTRFLLRRLEHDPELSAAWSRWHLVRACLAADPSRMSGRQSDNDFAARVAAVVGEESTTPSRRRSWARYVGGGAIAASVAVAALMLGTPDNRIATAPAPVADANPAASSVPTSPAEVAPHTGMVTPPWLLARQPTVLGAQPASANVIYGTGLMQPEYLRRATYNRGVGAVWLTAPHGVQTTPPRPTVLVPEARAPAGAPGAAQH